MKKKMTSLMSQFFFFISKYELLILLGLVASSCKQKPENQNVPPSLYELTQNHAREEEKWKQKKWDKFAETLHIGNNQVSLKDHKLDSVLGIDSQDAEKMSRWLLEQQLSQPSGLLVDESKREVYRDYLNKVSSSWKEKLYETRCSSIEGFKFLHPAGGYQDGKFETLVDKDGKPVASVYRLDYKLQSDWKGTPEQVTRTALLVIPQNKTKTSPLLVYSHAGDRGLVYGEIASIINQHQKKHIVLAPTFPGEVLYGGSKKTAYECTQDEIMAPAVGSPSPWDRDIDEVLGAQDCIERLVSASYLPGQGSSPLDLAEISTRLREEAYVSPTGYFQGRPLSLIVGSSRGGLTASLALAKSGVAWEGVFEEVHASSQGGAEEDQLDFLQGLMSGLAAQGPATGREEFLENFLEQEEVKARLNPARAPKLDRHLLSKAYGFYPARFSCSASISSPSSVLIGRFRLVLEILVKGNIEQTRFAKFPGLMDLKDAFTEYRLDRSEDPAKLERAVLNVFKRDLPLLTPYMLAALRNWSKVDPMKLFMQKSSQMGALLFLHGEEDRIVPFEQSKFAVNVIDKFRRSPEVLQKAWLGMGEKGHTLFSRGFRYEGPISADMTHHFDDAFLKSFSLIPHDFFVDSKKSFRFLPWKQKTLLYERLRGLLGSTGGLEEAPIFGPQASEPNAQTLSELGALTHFVSDQMVALPSSDLRQKELAEIQGSIEVIKGLFLQAMEEDRKALALTKAYYGASFDPNSENSEARAFGRSLVFAGILSKEDGRALGSELLGLDGEQPYLRDIGKIPPDVVFSYWRNQQCEAALK
ncbi:MAG: hypothetical protein KA436_10455 [Oligoflexales bacterium]|nr:hypothetical protein [Oligoflexales bacterium]